MGEKELDRILDAVMKAKEELIREEATEEERNELIASLREQRKKIIIQEIRQEYKEELIREADLEVKERVNRQKLDELKKLMFSGFLLAFIVGLAVNQATEIIGYYKGTITADNLWITLVLTGGLCLICLLAYLYSFFKDVMALLDDLKSKKEKS
ncbi:MAG: hypothetical protein HFH33_01945 [Eubacterium sp.]|jgi:Fatty-acid desaturase|nr:hypothetical protein [Eubacterium sp.]